MKRAIFIGLAVCFLSAAAPAKAKAGIKWQGKEVTLVEWILLTLTGSS